MSQQKNGQTPIDIWDEIHSLFESSGNEHPELYITNLSPAELGVCLRFMIRSSRTIMSRFMVPDTEIPVQFASDEAAIEAIIKGRVSASIWIEFYAMPPVTLYIDEPSLLSISYSRREWTAQSILIFLDLLWVLTTLAPSIELYPDTYYYTQEQQTRFMKVWQQYQHD